MHHRQVEEAIFPKFLERFAQLSALLEEQHFAQSNVAIWQFAIFTHLVQKKQFLNALPYLKKVHLALLEKDQLHKLARLTQNIKQQYEKFLVKKGLTLSGKGLK